MASAAGLLKVFAQTDPSLGWRGIAAFLVKGDAQGLERLPAYGMMGGPFQRGMRHALHGCSCC